jgi:hypothetical protein
MRMTASERSLHDAFDPFEALPRSQPTSCANCELFSATLALPRQRTMLAHNMFGIGSMEREHYHQKVSLR